MEEIKPRFNRDDIINGGSLELEMGYLWNILIVYQNG